MDDDGWIITYMNNYEDSPLEYLIESKAFPFLV